MTKTNPVGMTQRTDAASWSDWRYFDLVVFWNLATSQQEDVVVKKRYSNNK